MPAVEQFGRIGRQYTAARTSGASLYESSQDDGFRLSRPLLDSDIQRLLSRQKHRMLLSDARYIATWAMVEGGISQKADYVSSGGWLPTFTGSDENYAATVTPILHAALNILDARGPLYTWDRDWWIASRLLDIDGDFVIIRQLSATGFPQVQMIEAHRIGCRNGETQVLTGPYTGLPILNGIIYNPAARPVALRFLADDPAQDQDISMRDCDYVAHPRWFSDGRPFPAIAYAVLDWYDAKSARGFEKQAQQVNSALALIEANDTGTARPGISSGAPPAPVPGTSTTPSTELLAGGLIRYIKAGGGRDVKARGIL